MALLAIKGHPTRGKEVIEILEMLGGNNIDHYSGFYASWHYTIVNNKIVWGYLCAQKSNFIIFTLEEFLEKFPYKVGDKVVYKYDKKTYFIRKMFWENGKILYELSDEIYSDGCSIPDTLIFDVDAVKLQLYKEETMKDKIESYEILESHCANEVKIEFDPSKYEMVKRDNGYYVVKKQPKYPKTYEECCNVLKIEYPHFKIEEDMISASTYKNKLFGKFKQLLICRDAYWKIGGDWKYDVNKTEEYFYIVNKCGRIVKEHYMNFNHILAFPTAEMRDAFYENFKELINVIKELL